MADLASFQDAFAAALAGGTPDLSAWLAPDSGQTGLSVYRNTVAKGWVDALSDRFPTVVRAVGEDWFIAAALDFARDHPPAGPILSTWGDHFPDWLAAFPPAADLPYLAGVARLDGFWAEAYLAADAVPLAASAFAGLGPDDLAGLTARLHPSARFGWFDDGAAQLWRLTRPPHTPPAVIDLSRDPEGVLVLRPDAEVEIHLLGAHAHIFLLEIQAGRSLAAAARAAVARDPSTAFAPAFAALISAGVFVRLAPVAHPPANKDPL